jgi:hypothetical protein
VAAFFIFERRSEANLFGDRLLSKIIAAASGVCFNDSDKHRRAKGKRSEAT